ncbi:MAG: tetratricopeptide repeat protein [Candidatus Neomarinimicrobiota bacterium]
MEFLSSSNLQITLIIVLFFALIIFYAVSNRSKNVPSDTEAFNTALKALVNGNKDKAYMLLREIIAKDSNNIDAYLLLGDIVREKDINQAIKIHQTIVLRPQITKNKKIEAHIALSKDFLAQNNFIRAENELNNIITMDSSNKWALLNLKEISTKNNNWKDALKYEKKLMNIDVNHKKNDESMLNYYIAMDYRSKDNIKKYVYYLEKSASCKKVYPNSLLELAKHNISNVDLAIRYYKLYAKYKPSERTMAYNKVENLLFDNQRFDDVEILYKDLLNDGFDGFALNRLIDIMLEKNEKSEASDLVDRFMKSEHACHSIRLNKLKLETDNFEARKSISTLCNEMIRDEIII